MASKKVKKESKSRVQWIRTAKIPDVYEEDFVVVCRECKEGKDIVVFSIPDDSDMHMTFLYKDLMEVINGL
jgi:hypothetical protein